MLNRSGTGGGANVSMLVLAEPTVERPAVVGDDYLVCRSWDGATAGGSDIFVAKQYKHRCSLTGEKMLGTDYTYEYFADSGEPTPRQNKLRDVTDESENIETQRIVPPWVVSRTEGEVFIPGDIVFALSVEHSGVSVGGAEVTLLDCCSSRQWARTWSTTFGD
jgi:hypothetical protein